ncbi:MAG TPA: RNA-binding protein [Kiritimatiellae bacterium]|nr:RNA-binding protein [Kiritimatiellia bacterium]
MSTRLYVGNLSYSTMESDIADLFSQAGQVVSCHLMLDRNTNRSRGFAFVEMASEAEAARAIELFNGKEFQGRALRVNEARPRERQFEGGRFEGRDRRRW